MVGELAGVDREDRAGVDPCLDAIEEAPDAFDFEDDDPVVFEEHDLIVLLSDVHQQEGEDVNFSMQFCHIWAMTVPRPVTVGALTKVNLMSSA